MHTFEVDIHVQLFLFLRFAGNETAERAVFWGYVTVLLFYLTDIVHLSFPATVTAVTNLVGAACLTPLLGAFLADAYWGRYWTIGIFTTIYIVVSSSSISCDGASHTTWNRSSAMIGVNLCTNEISFLEQEIGNKLELSHV